jgi:hypothetical protein
VRSPEARSHPRVANVKKSSDSDVSRLHPVIVAANWLQEEGRDLPDGAARVLVALANHANAEGVCWPSLRRLAECVNASESKVTRALDGLLAHPRTIVVRKFRRRGTPIYQLQLASQFQGSADLLTLTESQGSADSPSLEAQGSAIFRKLELTQGSADSPTRSSKERTFPVTATETTAAAPPVCEQTALGLAPVLTLVPLQTPRPSAADSPSPERSGLVNVEPSKELALNYAPMAKELFTYWQLRCGHPRAQLTKQRLAALEARLREEPGDTTAKVAGLKRAVDGAVLDPWYNGSENGRKLWDFENVFVHAGRNRIEKLQGSADRYRDGLPKKLLRGQNQEVAQAFLAARKATAQEVMPPVHWSPKGGN